MGEISNMGLRTLDDPLIVFKQFVKLFAQWQDLGGVITFKLGLTTFADIFDIMPDSANGAQR